MTDVIVLVPFFLFSFVVVDTEPRILDILSKHATTELRYNLNFIFPQLSTHEYSQNVKGKGEEK